MTWFIPRWGFGQHRNRDRDVCISLLLTGFPARLSLSIPAPVCVPYECTLLTSVLHRACLREHGALTSLYVHYSSIAPRDTLHTFTQFVLKFVVLITGVFCFSFSSPRSAEQLLHNASGCPELPVLEQRTHAKEIYVHWAALPWNSSEEQKHLFILNVLNGNFDKTLLASHRKSDFFREKK